MNKRVSFGRLLRVTVTMIGILIMLLAMTCATRVPLHARMLVQGIGIDKGGEGQFHVTVQAVSTSAGAAVEVYQADGSSVFDALNSLTVVSGKAPFYTHNSVIIIGRACAEAGLNDVLDFFVRYHQTRPAENLFLADGKAEEILTLKSGLQISVEDEQLQTNEYVMASQIEQLASAGNLNAQLLQVRVLDVAGALASGSGDVYLPVLSAGEQEIRVAGCAVFSGDKLQSVLDSRGAMGVEAVNNTLAGGTVTAALDGADATLSIVRSDCGTTAEIRDGVPHFTLALSCEMNLDELSRPLTEQLTEDDLTALQEAASESIRAIVTDTLEATIRQQIDVAGFSSALLHQQTAWWKANQAQWRSLLPRCTYTVEVSASITSEGQEMSPQVLS